MDSQAILEKTSSVLETVVRFFENGQFDLARESLQQHLEANPDDVAALHLLGATFARQNDFINAEKAFKRELQIDPSRVDAFFNLGLIHSQQNRLPEAIEDFEHVIELRPQDVQALNDLGVIHFKLGNLDIGELLFSKALALNPAFKDAFLNLFELCWNKAEYNRALEHAYNYLKELDRTVRATAENDFAAPGQAKAPTQPKRTLEIKR